MKEHWWLEFEIPLDKLKSLKEFDPATSRLRFKFPVGDYFSPKVPGEIVVSENIRVTCEGTMVVDTIKSVPYQLCPKCGGEGKMWSNSIPMSIDVCHICDGKGIIPMAVINKQ